MPEMFGKRYEWDFSGGRLSLVKPWAAPVVDTEPLTYEGFIRGLEEIEATAYPVPKLFLSGTVEEWAREELRAYGVGERARRIPMAGRGHGVSDQEEGGDEQVSGEGGERVSHSALAREEGDGAEEGVRGTSSRTCTACWFDNHGGCAGPRHCACWVCYEEEAQGV